MFEYKIDSPEQMEAFGARLAQACPAGCIIFLHGQLGAGKTTLVRGFLRKLGYQGLVKSPTYTLIEPYKLQEHYVFHFDLYRLQNPEELNFIGIDEYLTQQAWCLIEWPEKGEGYLPVADVDCVLIYQQSSRLLRLSSNTKIGKVGYDRLVHGLRVEQAK